MRLAVIDWTIIPAFLALTAGPASAFTAEDLYRSWPEGRFVDAPAPCLGHDALESRLHALASRHAGELKLEQVGTSVQGRAIRLLTLGRGERKVLLWSQMHGDEPSATPALLDIADYLLTHGDDPDVATILDHLTLLMVPMLNPDGAEVYRRENAQAIDVNRDALNLATPEGRLLKELRDRHEPVLGFNLHDQNRRRTAGDTGVLATNSVLAVSGDAANTLTPGRLRAQRACVAIVDALGRFLPGAMGRWDDDFNPRAFGDQITAWGTPVVLIESGGLPAGRPFTDLTRLNFVAILVALRDLARDDLAQWDAARYADIPENDLGDWVDVVVRGGQIRQPGSPEPYRADLPFDVLRADQEIAGCPNRRLSRSEIRELGDARLLTAGRNVDAGGQWIVAPFTVGVAGERAQRWLDGTALDRLARLGVAEVRWQVSRRQLADAEERARELAGPRRARLAVQVDPLPRDLPRIEHAPTLASSARLYDFFTALFGAAGGRQLTSAGLDSALQRLWGGTTASRALLAPDRPASFLLISPAPAGDASLDSAVGSVWIDGLEIELSK
jgi:hypothetical protein